MKKIFISFELLEECERNFQKKACLVIILKVTKIKGFTFFPKNSVLKKPQKTRMGGKGSKYRENKGR